MPRASIVVVNYNGRAYLEGCLSSLLAAAGDDELIVVDNASSDGSAELILQRFPQVRLICSERNLGFAQGNNLGAQHARGRYLVFINPDTVVEPDWLDQLVAAVEADPRAGLATPKILLLRQPELINTCGNATHCTGLTLCRGMGQRRTSFDAPQEVNAVSGAAFLIRRDLFERLEGFDANFFLYVEETDLSLRARLAGYRCLYVPTALIYHDYTLRFGPLKTYYQERNRYIMLLKTLRWRSLLALLPALLLGELVTWGFVLLRDRAHLGNKLRAYLWVSSHWRSIMAWRRRTQLLRAVPDRELLRAWTHRLEFEQVGESLITRMAHLLLDPLFYLAQRFALLCAD